MNEPITFKKTGIPDIDEQHGQLVFCLQRLLMWIDKGRGLAATFDAFAALFAYTQTHFDFEERLMRDQNYPQLIEHVAQHQAIVFELIRLQSDLLSGKDVEAALTEALRTWIVRHIEIHDMDYADFMARKGQVQPGGLPV
jgi:hemerythrin